MDFEFKQMSCRAFVNRQTISNFGTKITNEVYELYRVIKIQAILCVQCK